MKMFLWSYINSESNAQSTCGSHWCTASLDTAQAAEHGPWLAQQLREWTQTFILDRKSPFNIYGCWNVSILEDEDLAQRIHLHLQSIGQYVKAADIINYLNTPEMKT